MLHLPAYNEIKHLEGQGNYAVSKYYKFPFSYFYRHKLKMILKMIGKKRYYNILDFGCGDPCIFKPELSKRCFRYLGYMPCDTFDPNWKFDLVVCASVLEFVDLNSTMSQISSIQNTSKELIVASPLYTLPNRIYFKLSKSNYKRNDHHKIIRHIDKFYNIEEYKEWLGLYFCLRARRK